MFQFFILVGTVYSILSWVIVAGVPIRRIFSLKQTITERHLNMAGIALLIAAVVTTCGYLFEFWFAWYGHSRSEWDPIESRLFKGAYGKAYCFLLITNSVLPMLLWFRCVRCNDYLLFLISLMVHAGIWIERIVFFYSFQSTVTRP